MSSVRRGRYQGRHRGRHRAPAPSLRERFERPGAGALTALGVAALVTAGGSKPIPEKSTDPLVADAPTGSLLALAGLRSDLAEARADRQQVRGAVPSPTSVPTAVPAPAPAPVAAPAQPSKITSKSTSSTTTSTGGSGGSVNTGGYAAAAAAIGLRGYAIGVYSAVRTRFGVTNIGGYRAGDPLDHGKGKAVDVMTSNRSLGDAIADFVIANAGTLHVKYVIWRQRIWEPGKGWKAMSDRGSVTANHYDHVHISVF